MTEVKRTIEVDGKPSTVKGTPYDPQAWKRKTPAREVIPFPGLFYYHGFGYGEYFSTDGVCYWTNGSESHALAKADGVKREYIDALEGYKGVYLGD